MERRIKVSEERKIKMCVLENKKLKFCKKCAYYYCGYCNVITQKITHKEIVNVHSKYDVLNKDNNCEHFEKVVFGWLGSRKEKKKTLKTERSIRPSEREQKPTSYYEKCDI